MVLFSQSPTFEHAIVKGGERKVGGCRSARECINKAATHVHRHRRIAVVEQKIKISPAFRAARHLDLRGHVHQQRFQPGFTGITFNEAARRVQIEERAIIDGLSLAERLLRCRRRIL